MKVLVFLKCQNPIKTKGITIYHSTTSHSNTANILRIQMYIMFFFADGVSRHIHLLRGDNIFSQVDTFGDFPWTKRKELTFSLHNNMTTWGKGNKSEAVIARHEMLHFCFAFFPCDFSPFYRSQRQGYVVIMAAFLAVVLKPRWFGPVPVSNLWLFWNCFKLVG